MKFIAVGVLLSLVLVSGASSGRENSCVFGRVQGFVSVRADPEYLVGTIPGHLTAQSKFFSRRYNCKRFAPLIKRVDTGVYDVRFPGLSRRTAFVTAISQEGVTTSVQPLGETYRVALRGPLVVDGALVRRDVAFSIAVF